MGSSESRKRRIRGPVSRKDHFILQTMQMPNEIIYNILRSLNYDELMESYQALIEMLGHDHESVETFEEFLDNDTFYKNAIIENYGKELLAYIPSDDMSYKDVYIHMSNAKIYNENGPPLLDRLIAIIYRSTPHSPLLNKILRLREQNNVRRIKRFLTSNRNPYILRMSVQIDIENFEQLIRICDSQKLIINILAFENPTSFLWLIQHGIYPSAPLTDYGLSSGSARLLIALDIIPINHSFDVKDDSETDTLTMSD